MSVTVKEELAADETFDQAKDDPLEHLLGIGYDNDVTLDVYGVLRETAVEGFWYEKAAEKLSLQRRYVHLILELLAREGVDLVEYGTSPRGAWITDRGREILEWK